MEWEAMTRHTMDYIKKYRYVLLIVFAGIVLMSIPEKENTQISSETAVAEDRDPVDLQQSLADILGKIEGAGKVEVLLAPKSGAQTLYQMDEDRSSDASSNEIRRETVLVTGSDREEAGLITQINPPTYQGAVILCQGADRAEIRLSIVEAVISATGLTSDKITVLKMK